MNNYLNQIQIFSQVAHYLSFTKAANALNVEKSTVSNKINQLETHLNIRLLERTTRSVRLTEAGKLYLQHCQQALTSLQAGEALMSELNHEVVGKLRVSIPNNLADVIMSSVVEPFLRKNPKASLELVQTDNDVNLHEHHFDAAIQPRLDAVQDSSLIYRLLFQSHWALVASKEFITQNSIPSTAKQLSALPAVGMTNNQSHQYIYMKDEKVSLNYRFSVNNFSAILSAVDKGLGYCIVPRNMVKKQLNEGHFIQIKDGIEIAPMALYLIYPSRTGQPAKTKAFVELMMTWADSMSTDKWRP
jgi:DNA-binding transcriptional LysR family regulator